jgi:hypothetical protein
MIFLLLFVHLLPCYTMAVVQLSCWHGKKGEEGPGLPVLTQDPPFNHLL